MCLQRHSDDDGDTLGDLELSGLLRCFFLIGFFLFPSHGKVMIPSLYSAHLDDLLSAYRNKDIEKREMEKGERKKHRLSIG